jgi:hypothetical protein
MSEKKIKSPYFVFCEKKICENNEKNIMCWFFVKKKKRKKFVNDVVEIL